MADNAVVIVDCGVYRNGKRRRDVSDIRAAVEDCRREPGAFVWLGMVGPDAAELATAAEQFGLHRLAVEDAVKAHQRPKLEQYGESLFVVVKTVGYHGMDGGGLAAVHIGEVMLFVGDSFVVSVRHGESVALADVRRRLDEDDEMARHGPLGVLYAVCDHIVDDYMAVALQFEKDVDDLEQRVFAPGRTDDTAQIYVLRREVLEFRRAVLPLLTPMDRLATGAVVRVAPEVRPFFRDVADHVARVADAVDNFDALLQGVLQANLALVSVRQNEDMRRISAWVAMAAVPTVIAGIYGMNFHHMPELSLTFGYPLTIAIMLTICGLLYRVFRRSGWL